MSNRDRAIQKVTQGKTHYNQEKEYDAKLKGYNLFIDGVQDLMNYVKTEQNQEVVKVIKGKINEFLNDAKMMKSELNNIMPFEKKQEEEKKNNSGNSKIKNDEGDGEGDKLQSALSQAIVTEKPNVKWDDVAGLINAKKALEEAITLPIKFPEMFQGVRQPWKGILMYGPPGTGKSFLAKACATECDATFFSVSSADLVSKYVGESEKLIKELFKMARERKPSIIFIDEVDSMCSARGEGSSEASNRVKTQFLVEMQGVGHDDKGVLVLAATNIPWGLDAAIRRRFEKRIMIPLPDEPARFALVKNLIKNTPNSLNEEDITYLAVETEGYSGSDLSNVVKDAAYAPIRKCQRANKFKQMKGNNNKLQWFPCAPSDPAGKDHNMMDFQGDELGLPQLDIEDFIQSLQNIKPTVATSELEKQIEFTEQFGMEG